VIPNHTRLDLSRKCFCQLIHDANKVERLFSELRNTETTLLMMSTLSGWTSVLYKCKAVDDSSFENVDNHLNSNHGEAKIFALPQVYRMLHLFL
jgi:hypothetical protein